MKNLTKIFMAVCVALFAFACATDPTEDRGVNLGAEGQTTLTLSLEGTKTHLGELSGEQYPLYWSEGDAIAVNGHASVALTAEQAGEANATFTFNEVSDLGEVYNIVYPAPAADVAASATEGCYPVVFASAQQYDAEHPTLVNAPLYGYANAGEGATLKHLSGVLRIAPKGEGVTLTSLVVKAGKGAISGAFDVDCATGALTAREEASNTVTVTFGEGLTLGAEATPIYVVVPAGEFGVFSITLNTATDAMALAFDSSTNAISAGRVRHFDEFEYKSNVEADGVYYIDSKEALIRFSKVASNFAPYTSAKVVANIDMTGIAWTSIEGFEHSFDGGSDKGFEIKGLTAPLFGITAATEIKNVKLTNVNINETENPTVGALARSINNTNAVVTNCSASGNIKMHYEKDLTSALHLAGLIASTTSTKTFSNLTNEVNIEVTGTYNQNIYCVGCVGSASSTNLTNLTNLGNLTFGDITTERAGLCGIAGTAKTITNGVNGAKGDPTKGILTYASTKSSSFWAAGISCVTSAAITLTKCINYGTITSTENSVSNGVIAGGIFGNCQHDSRTFTFDGCENHGKIDIKAKTISGNIKIGGGWAQLMGDSSTVKILNGFTNTGEVSLSVTNVTSGNTFVAGVVATYSKGFHTDSHGVIKNTGTIKYNVTNSAAGYSRIAGCLSHTSVYPPNDSDLSFVNTGDIIAEGQYGGAGHVGGVYGTARHNYNSQSVCNIKAIGFTNVGMVTSIIDSTYKTTNCHCGGSIWKDGNEPIEITPANYFKYICAYEISAETAKNATCGYIDEIDGKPIYDNTTYEINSVETLKAFAEQAETFGGIAYVTGDIDMTDQNWTPINGVLGIIDGKDHKITGLTAPLFGTTEASIKNLHLENVNIEVTSASEDYFGVLASNINSTNAAVTNCSVSGTLNVNTTKATLHIGGLVGTTTSTKTFSNLTNYMDITLEGQYSSKLRVAGCVHTITSGKLLNVRNLGDIKYQGTSCGDLRLAGVTLSCKNIEECYNGSNEDAYKGKGEITINGTCSGPRIGGIIPVSIDGSTLTRCINYSKICFLEEAKTTAIFLGGIMGLKQNAAVTFDACENHGELALEQSTSTNGNVRVGGLVGQVMSSGTFVVKNGFINTGAINVNPKSVTYTEDIKDLQISGFIPNYSIAMTAESTGVIKNAGDITYSGNSTVVTRIGGLWGASAQTLPDVAESVLRYENTGNITVTGTGSSIHVGGICAIEGRMAIRNARCYCTIITTKNIPRENIGMIMPGPPTDKVYAYNCHIGGYVGNIEDNGYIDKFELDDYTYVEYIYGTLVEPNDALSNKLGWLQDGINSNPVGGDLVPIQ